MTELREQVTEAFLKYGTAEWVSSKLVAKCLEFEVKYKTEGYEGDTVPASWDDYILTEDAEMLADVNDGINDDIEEEDGEVEARKYHSCSKIIRSK